jgi:hypothetical protein
MKRMLMALSASTVLFNAMLVPSAGASAGPGHGPGATGTQVRHDANSPVRATSLGTSLGAGLSPIKTVPLGASLSAIKAVSLGASFSPPSVTLSPGEPLIIVVSHSVRARLGIASGGSLVFAGHSGYVYLFYAKKAGTSVVSAQVRPRCRTKVCPQWRTAPELMVTTF